MNFERGHRIVERESIKQNNIFGIHIFAQDEIVLAWRLQHERHTICSVFKYISYVNEVVAAGKSGLHGGWSEG